MPDNLRIIQKEEHFAIENIFGKPPGWIVNWGITSGFLFLLVCLGIASFVNYPDKLMLTANVFSENPPIEVLSKKTSRIISILADNNSDVEKEQIIIKLESTVSEKDIEHLEKFFLEFESVAHIPSYLSIKFPNKLNLGSFTPTYTRLMNSFDEFKYFLRQSAVFTKMIALNQEITQIQKLNQSLSKQESLYKSDVSLTEKDFKRNLELEKDGVIAEADKEKAESKLLGEQRNLEAFKTNQINNIVRIQQLKIQINDLKSERANGVSTRIFSIQQIINEIKGEIKEWEDFHVIRSPIIGTVTFTKYWNKNQSVQLGESLFTAIPKIENQNFIARGNLPIRSSGNLKIGQHTLIELENYPSNQYGVLSGIVSDISNLPTEDYYIVTIKLPENLITSYGKTIPKKQNMKANMTIQTKEYSLLERLFQNILDITKNKN